MPALPGHLDTPGHDMVASRNFFRGEKMFQKCLTFGFVCALAASAAGAETAEELIAKNLAARGGEARLMACNSIRMSGELPGPSGKVTFLVEVKHPDKILLEAKLGDKRNLTIIDGAEGWEIPGISGNSEPRKMNEQQIRHLKFRTNYRGDLVDARQPGTKVEYQGQSDLDGTAAHVLKLTKGNGDVVVAYLDPKTFLEIKESHVVHVGEFAIELETMYKDYREVDGLVFAQDLGIQFKGEDAPQWFHVAYEVNPELPDSRFTLAGQGAAAAKQ